MLRKFSYEISEDIKQRWSPRAFSSEDVSKTDIMALLEAAHYAPSCYNEQPWRFIIAASKDQLAIMRSLLYEANQLWANKAPILIAIVAKDIFSNGKPNCWSAFDAGAAWGYLSLEAHRRGLITHAMGGFSREKSRELLGIPAEHSIISIVAVGKMGNMSELPQELREKEQPALRRDLEEVVFYGKFS